jgi:hypothetical protein
MVPFLIILIILIMLIIVIISVFRENRFATGAGQCDHTNSHGGR